MNGLTGSLVYNVKSKVVVTKSADDDTAKLTAALKVFSTRLIQGAAGLACNQP